MNSGLLLQTLERLEAKIDKLGDEVAEIRGARKLALWLAPIFGAVAGWIAGHK